MESEFEPAVLTEETHEARIVLVDLPGFRTEDMRIQVNSQGKLIISGERDVKEMGEITKVEGRLEKMQSGEHSFRKVISVPENVNTDKITATVKDRVLRVTLPFIRKNQKSLTEDIISGSGKPHAADPLEQSKPDERSSPVKQHGLMQEVLAAAQYDQSARFPEVIRPDDSKAKASAAAEKSKEEAPKHAQDFVHGEPAAISTHTQAASAQASSDRDRSEFLQPKSRPRKKESEIGLPSSNYEFPEKRIQDPSSARRSMFYNQGLLIASTVLVLGAYMYLSYLLRPQKAADRKP